MRAITSASMLSLAVVCGAAQAQETSRGQMLYETHCATCHTERLHDREKSIIRNYADLRAEVHKRAAMTNRRFTRDELEDIIEFLDRSHYRLDVPRGKKP
jgi:mono/diheme cytochrome c family protein